MLTTQPPAVKGPAIPISESQYLKIAAAAQWLAPSDRDQFWQAIAEDLAGHELADGLVTRAITKAFKEFYRPIQLNEAPRPRAYFKRAG